MNFSRTLLPVLLKALNSAGVQFFKVGTSWGFLGRTVQPFEDSCDSEGGFVKSEWVFIS